MDDKQTIEDLRYMAHTLIECNKQLQKELDSEKVYHECTWSIVHDRDEEITRLEERLAKYEGGEDE